MLELLTDPHVWASFVALSAMEIVLGIDNVVFISVMVARMPPEQQLTARRIGLSLALIFRVIMLAGHHLVHPPDDADLHRRRILVLLARPDPIAGGLFLIVKGTREIHHDIEGEDRTARSPARWRAAR